MEEFRIKSFNEFHDVIDHKTSGVLYRGQSNGDWELIPKAGRHPFNRKNDKVTFDYFKRNAIPFLKNKPNNNWDWLTVAQHYGVPTRLLDWTTNPMVAAFFAVADDNDSDAAIFRFHHKEIVLSENIDPFMFKKVAVYRPSAYSERVIRQKGYFTIHPDPNVSFVKSPPKGMLEKIVIEKKYRKTMKAELRHYGFTHFEIFGDIEGLASYINWRLLNREDFDK